MGIHRDDRIAICYDAEFTGLHRNTTLISIGMVSYSGAYFYAEFIDYDQSQVTEWIQENVIDKLPYKNIDKFISTMRPFGIDGEAWRHYNVTMKDTTAEIKEKLVSWLWNESHNGEMKIQFYTDCYAYDWVLLNDLICDDGQALNLPKHIDYIPMDLSTTLQIAGEDPDVTREDFISDAIATMQNMEPFTRWGSNIKHNSLWDAYVCKVCFDKCKTLDW